MAAVDTISQTLTSARDQIMGASSTQSGEEPLSGVQGKGTVNEPYDQGNTNGVPPTCAIPRILPY